jgi:hypothetical protein
MFKVEVKSSDVNQRTIHTKSGERTLREQTVYFCLDNDFYPVKGRINVPDDCRPYLPGDYTILSKSIRVGRFGSLEFDMYTYLEPLNSDPALLNAPESKKGLGI